MLIIKNMRIQIKFINKYFNESKNKLSKQMEFNNYLLN